MPSNDPSGSYSKLAAISVIHGRVNRSGVEAYCILPGSDLRIGPKNELSGFDGPESIH
jgi:hypothetical protein